MAGQGGVTLVELAIAAFEDLDGHGLGVVPWSYSNCPFAIALPTERTEAILAGMVQAFEFFGCVPREAWGRGGMGVVYLARVTRLDR